MKCAESLTYELSVHPTGLRRKRLTFFQHVLTTTFFKWDNQIHEQMNGVVMENLLSPLSVNYSMKDFEGTAPKIPTL